MRKIENTMTAGVSWLFTGSSGIGARAESKGVRHGIWKVDGIFCRVKISGASDRVYVATGGMYRL